MTESSSHTSEFETQLRECVNKRAALESRLRESERKYYELITYLPVGVYRTSPDGKFIEANKGLADLLGFEKHTDLFQYNVRELYVDESDRVLHLKKLDESLTYFTEFRLRRKDGRIIHVRDYPRAIKGNENRIIYYAGILIDITQEKEAQQKLENALTELEASNQERLKVISKLRELSLLDELTGIYNRRGFFTAAQEQLIQADREKKRIFLIFIDLDNLKAINDKWGHSRGDEAIVKFIEILGKSLRKSDIKGRIGGDEFAVLIPEPARVSTDMLVTRFEENLKSFNCKQEFPFELAASIGICAYDPKKPCTIGELLARADRLMYEQKQQHHAK